MNAALLWLLAAPAAQGHGSTSIPLPRNNDPTAATIDYGVRFRVVPGGQVAMDVFNRDDCGNGGAFKGGGYQTQTYPADQCVERPLTLAVDRPSYIFSTSPPARRAERAVDCTPGNNCSAVPHDRVVVAEEEGEREAEVIGLSAHAGNCSRPAAVSYKIRLGQCTQLPVSGATYWSGGCEGFACQWFSQVRLACPPPRPPRTLAVAADSDSNMSPQPPRTAALPVSSPLPVPLAGVHHWVP